ncbi:MAG: YggT family protein [Propionibacteriaceae bacterium]|nr:YggT family protein [Propionibacteriaceae bacterium]
MALIGVLIHGVLWSYLAVLTVRMVLSVMPLLVRQWEPRGVLLVIAEFVYTVTDPPLRFLRRFVPSPRLGDMVVDLPFTVLFLGLWLILGLLPF